MRTREAEVVWSVVMDEGAAHIRKFDGGSEYAVWVNDPWGYVRLHGIKFLDGWWFVMGGHCVSDAEVPNEMQSELSALMDGFRETGLGQPLVDWILENHARILGKELV